MKKILVIDDELAVRKAFSLALEDLYQVELAESGEVGLELASKNEYNLVFTDLKMPGINGVETLVELRKLGKTMPIYVVTAFHKSYFEELTAAKKAGYNFELARKPLGQDEIAYIAKLAIG